VSFPVPRPGLVIRYGFLWSHEAQAGAEDASKDRPCAIVVAAPRTEAGDITVIVAPITHTPPADDDSVEISAAVARGLGLDEERHWIRVDELNRFAWPGYDLRAIPGHPGEYAYGLLPEALYQAVRKAILERQKRVRPQIQKRD